MTKIPRIPESEWTVMEVIWKKNPITSREVIQTLEGVTEWNPKTVWTLIHRLTEKGVLSRKKIGRAFEFSPTLTREECLQAESSTFLSRFFGGALNPLLVHFAEKEDLGPEDIAKLKRIFSQQER